MNVANVLLILHQESENRAYIRRLEIRDHTARTLKARLIISSGLFVQIYRTEFLDEVEMILAEKNLP